MLFAIRTARVFTWACAPRYAAISPSSPSKPFRVLVGFDCVRRAASRDDGTAHGYGAGMANTNSPIGPRLKSEAEASARKAAAQRGDVVTVVVREPINTANQIIVPVRVLMKDVTQRCYEYRADAKGNNGTLWTVVCP